MDNFQKNPKVIKVNESLDTSLGDKSPPTFIMYHGTSAQSASSIIVNGFQESGEFRKFKRAKNAFGAGVYVSQDVEVAKQYGPVVFRLMVKLGKIFFAKKLGTDWHSTYDSAWIDKVMYSIKSSIQF